MTIENLEIIRSVTEAIIAARQAQKAGLIIPIEPCVQVSTTGGISTCKDLDPQLGTLCKNPEGVIPDGRAVLCPRQKGQLVIRR